MRMLMIHVNSFSCKITEQGRSRFVEPAEPPETVVGEALVVLSSVEKVDQSDPGQVAALAALEIQSVAENIKAQTVVLHPFAHLFADLGPPRVAVQVMELIKELLTGQGFTVVRTPFGWFNTLEISAKGHPYSRVARQVRVGEEN